MELPRRRDRVIHATNRSRSARGWWRGAFDRGSRWVQLLGLLLVLGPGPLAAASARSWHNVLEYGAVNDGHTNTTAAFARAVAACEQAGGGTVYVPPGRYLTGSIALVDNLTLHVEAGAELLYSGDPADSPLVPSRWEGTNVHTHAPLIYAQGRTNVTVTGRGLLNGQGERWWPQHQPEAVRRAAAAAWAPLFERIEAGDTVAPDEFVATGRHLRPSLVVFYACRNVVVEGVTLTNSPMWGLHPIYCEDVVIRNARFFSRGPNGDGIDIDSCRNVRISDCFFDTNDDCIALKSGRNQDGRRTARPTEYVTITNCVFYRGHGAVAIGSETAGSIRFVTASNMVCNGTDFGIRLKTQRARGGVVEHVRFSDWVIRGGVEEAIEITSDYRRDLPAEPFSERTPILRDIVISQVTIVGAAEVINLNGLDEQYVENVRLSDIRGQGRTGFECLESDGVELYNVQIDAEEGAPFIIRNSRNLRLQNLSTTRPPPAPVVEMSNVQNVVLMLSEARDGTDVFLDVSGAGSRNVQLQQNDLSRARTPLRIAGDVPTGVVTER